MLGTATHLIVICARQHRALTAERLQGLGLANGEELVLAELWREAGLTQAELARRLGVRRSTVTAVLRTMERHGVVMRIPDERDGRVARVRCTRRGWELRPAVEDLWQAAEAELLSDLLPDEVAVLRTLLTRIGSRTVAH